MIAYVVKEMKPAFYLMFNSLHQVYQQHRKSNIFTKIGTIPCGTFTLYRLKAAKKSGVTHAPVMLILRKVKVGKNAPHWRLN